MGTVCGIWIWCSMDTDFFQNNRELDLDLDLDGHSVWDLDLVLDGDGFFFRARDSEILRFLSRFV